MATPVGPQRSQRLYRSLRINDNHSGRCRLFDETGETQPKGNLKVIKHTQVGPPFANEREARDWALEVYAGQTIGGWGRFDRGLFGIALRPGDGEPPSRALFESRCADWREETAQLSDVRAICGNSNYQMIIGMGPPALPLILAELRDRPAFWFWALRAISSADPAEGVDGFERTCEAWLAWGRQQGLLPE